MTNRFFKSIHLKRFLSFPPDTEPLTLGPLNVLIGPNGSGKSNLIEAFDLLSALPHDLMRPFRAGGRPIEWTWKGEKKDGAAEAIVRTQAEAPASIDTYRVAFYEADMKASISEESFSNITTKDSQEIIQPYFKRNGNSCTIHRLNDDEKYIPVRLLPGKVKNNQSILQQRRDPESYPALHSLSANLSRIVQFREWTFGRDSEVRKPQDPTLPSDQLSSDASNLALILSWIIHTKETELNELLHQYLPRFEKLTTPVTGGTIHFFLREKGLGQPIPATRLSDGTLRMLAIIALVLSDTPPTLLCIEEPELGQHPFAVLQIAELLKEASKRMQIIVTTHSDTFVSALGDEPQSVIVCENNGLGTEMERLDRDKLAPWLEKYSLGDLWSRGQLGGNP